MSLMAILINITFKENLLRLFTGQLSENFGYFFFQNLVPLLISISLSLYLGESSVYGPSTYGGRSSAAKPGGRFFEDDIQEEYDILLTASASQRNQNNGKFCGVKMCNKFLSKILDLKIGADHGTGRLEFLLLRIFVLLANQWQIVSFN